jgi:hypothetical protein
MGMESDLAVENRRSTERQIEREHERRSQALDAALRWNASYDHGPQDPDQVIETARKYYAFLTGETTEQVGSGI